MIHQLDGADLDDAVAGFRVEAGGFGIEDDFAHDEGESAGRRRAAQAPGG